MIPVIIKYIPCRFRQGGPPVWSFQPYVLLWDLLNLKIAPESISPSSELGLTKIRTTRKSEGKTGQQLDGVERVIGFFRTAVGNVMITELKEQVMIAAPIILHAKTELVITI